MPGQLQINGKSDDEKLIQVLLIIVFAFTVAAGELQTKSHVVTPEEVQQAR
jgi:hypothetical protein